MRNEAARIKEGYCSLCPRDLSTLQYILKGDDVERSLYTVTPQIVRSVVLSSNIVAAMKRS
jgi:hypothetical protein